MHNVTVQDEMRDSLIRPRNSCLKLLEKFGLFVVGVLQDFRNCRRISVSKQIVNKCVTYRQACFVFYVAVNVLYYSDRMYRRRLQS